MFPHRLPRWPRASFAAALPVLLAGILLFGAVGLGAWTVRDAHRDARAGAGRILRNLAQALEQDIARGVGRYDAALRGAAEGLRLPGLAELGPELRHAALFGRTGDAEVAAVLLADERGNVAASELPSPDGVNLADRDWFRVHQKRPGAGLYASRPFRSRLTGWHNMAFSRRIERPGGGFGGVAMVGVRLSLFQDMFARLNLGVGGAAVLFRDDGVVLARWPYDEAQIGRDVGRGPIFQAVARDGRAAEGAGEGRSLLDGGERLFAYRRVAGLPLVVAVAFDKAEVLLPWRHKAAETAAVLLAACVLVALFAVLLRRELRRNQAAEVAARQAEQEARASEAQHRLLADNASDVITKLELDFTRTYASPACRAVFGYEPDEMVGGRPGASMHPDDQQAVYRAVRPLVQGRAERTTVAYRAQHRDGHWVPVEATLSLVRDPCTGAPASLVCALRDVTERSGMEERLRRAQRMEAVGQLTAGVAHDFNNLLQAQMAGLELLLGAVQGQERATRLAEMAIASSEKGARLTHSLLSFSRQQVLRPEAVDLPALLERLRALLSRTLDPRVRLRIRSGAHATPPLADPAQLEAALLNLCLNARDAMLGPGATGGELLVDVGDPVPGVAPEGVGDPARCVVLAVQDEGCGMDAATVARACEPFFTTKGVGKGSGLGLSMVQGFARQSGGGLRVQSRPGEGTRIEIWLPSSAARSTGGMSAELTGAGAHAAGTQAVESGTRAQAGAAVPAVLAPAAVPEAVGNPGSAGRVLLVDDEPAVRELVGEILAGEGFAVVQASSGEEALEVLRTGAPCDVLVTDYAMPGLTGGELVRAACRLRPGLPALVVTGYAEAAQLGEVPPGVAVAHKPFRGDQLAAAVARLLAAAAASPGPAPGPAPRATSGPVRAQDLLGSAA